MGPDRKRQLKRLAYIAARLWGDWWPAVLLFANIGVFTDAKTLAICFVAFVMGFVVASKLAFRFHRSFLRALKRRLAQEQIEIDLGTVKASDEPAAKAN